MDGDFDDGVDLYFGSTAPGDYAWMIPKDGGANIGIGIQTQFSRGKSLTMADDFFDQFEGEVTSMSGSISNFTKEHYLLVGMQRAWSSHLMERE